MARQWKNAYVRLVFHTKVRSIKERSADYTYLLACVKREVPADARRSLFVTDLWKMWDIACRTLETTPEQRGSPALLKTNKKFIRQELRMRGIMITPDQPMVVKIPACSRKEPRRVYAQSGTGW